MMSQFSTADAFWSFTQEIALQSRYLRSADVENFLNAVARTCHGRRRLIDKGTIFWRAQVGHDWVVDPEQGGRVRGPHSESRMKPLQDRAYEGRVNPKGIPCLYFATTREAAMSEVRPWIGSVVSVARFRTVRDVAAVDCSVLHGAELERSGDLSPDEIERIVWANIDHAFSRPVTRSDNTAEYAATQILAEVFQKQDFDGVVYKSAFSAEGYNVAFFDLSCAEQIESSLFQVESAKFSFKEIDG
ncbi:RES domain-containing protein [Phyllobacterium phragmitis]|uniref:RES domain-containing protein n=2 Tax=Phyllobacterium phragmitis TaxID=2670329 RepID=A0A2S9IT83_9HYPH|nr:RES domain-containing protein [Phyllobacterium phragmitis]